MNVLDLFLSIKRHWPNAICISSSELLPNNGFLSWSLIELEEVAAASTASEIDLIQAAVWPFHQALTELSRTKYLAGETLVMIDDVPLEAFERFLLTALKDDSWSVARENFFRANPDYHSASRTERDEN